MLGRRSAAWSGRGRDVRADLAILRLAGESLTGGARERRARDELGLTPVAQYQQLNALLDRPKALAADPLLVNRLRRWRERLHPR